MELELQIHSKTMHYTPIVEDGVTVDWERSGVPGKLSFTVLDDGILKIAEGNAVTLTVDGTPFFLGYLFSRKRQKDNRVQCTAYDQLRYLKNKDTYNYTQMTADGLIRLIAEDFQLKTGILEPTGYVIAERSEDSQTLFDIIQTALSITNMNTGRLFVLYDDNGLLTLKDIEHMQLDLLIDAQTAQDFDYSCSIDGQTYNKIKITQDDQEAGQRRIFAQHDPETIQAWGILQYTETAQDGENGQVKADTMLKLYNHPTRNLSVSGALGDIRVRGGSMLPVYLDLGDTTLNNLMLVEKVRHKFSGGLHTMDLTLRGGGEFVI